MKNIIFFILLVTSFSFGQMKKEVVLFEYNKYNLTNEAKAKIDLLLKTTKIDELSSLEIYGNTDSDGDVNYNNTLSENRANSIKKYLISKGISSDIFSIKFNGENKPIAKNKDDFGKQQNRRVEIVLNYKLKEVNNRVFEKFEKESQFFSGKSNEVIKITGNEGTKITIPKNALKKKNGKFALGKIDFELKEFYKKSDIVLANLHSMSDDEMLETGGMIYFKATSEGEELILKKGTNLIVEMESKNNPANMQTFYGYPQTDNSVNWSTKETAETDSKSELGSIIFYTTTSRNDTINIANTGKDSIISDTYTKKVSKSARRIAELDKNILRSAKLGWINCDRFYDVQEATNLFVDIDLSLKPEIRLIFKDINSIMKGYFDGDKKMTFAKIPVGKKATIVAFSYVNDETYFTMKEILLEKENKITIELKKSSFEEYQKALSEIN